ncbi:aspartate aminotransferase family protein [Leucothrix sargassi]|nr:aspartate aminotransferase family protein [Leucothrix sargassi]
MVKHSSAVMHRSSRPNLATIASGDGVYLIDQQGNRFLDACGGAAVSCLGHSNERVKQAIIDQVNKVPYAHTSFFTNEPQEQLAEHLLQHAYGDFSQVYFVMGGSEAIETSLKLTRQYFLEVGKPEKKLFITRKQSYHGNTLGALAIGGNLWRRKPFDPLLVDGHYISSCYEYRDRQEDENEFQYGQRIANELETKILSLGAENVAAFVAETVGGATAGCPTAPIGYFKRIREICDQYDVLLILDEIMCGMGRTGTLHACEQEGVQADIETIAKGIGAGYQGLGAVLINDKIVDAIDQGSGFFQHGHTYIGHPSSCAAGLATQLEIQERNLLSNVQVQGDNLKKALQTAFDADTLLSDHIGDIRGRGLFIGIELVAKRQTKQPFDASLKLHANIKKQAMKNHLMTYPMGGTIDGIQGDHVLLAPPFIITEEHVQQITQRLSKSIKSAIEAT